MIRPVLQSLFAAPIRARRCCWRGSFAVLALLAAATSQPTVAASETLDTVRARGVLQCGVHPGLPGFARADSLGEYTGLDVDFCRAVASAIFNDPEAVEFTPASATERFELLLAGNFDLLARNTTWTLSRNASYGEFIGVNYYDGQGFMVSKRTGIRSALELDNQKICVSRGTTTELNAADFFKVSRMRYRPVYFDDSAGVVEAFEKGDCVAMTTDRSGLAAQRTAFATPDAWRILPEIVSKEPLGPIVRAGDAGWANIVRWTLNCMINAEEMGIARDNVTANADNDNPAVRRLLGLEGDAGELLGLDARWCANVIANVGNYAESYDRNVGPATALGLDRGVNQLWTNGGLLYAPPIR